MASDPDGRYVGLDLGTSGLKGVVLDGAGEVTARASASYPTTRPGPGAAEQDPRDWVTALQHVAAELARQAPPGQWRSIGLSAMIPTLVTAGADGRPTGSAITWEDGRAEAQAEQLREAFGQAAGGSCESGGDALYRVTGQWVDGRYLLPMFLRLLRADPGRAAVTTTLLAAKDYLMGWLTGHVATDPSTATGFGCFSLGTGQWHPKALTAAAAVAQAGLAWRPLPALPAVHPSMTTWPLRAEVAARFGSGQVPVCLGAADSVLGALGLGMSEPGQVAYVAGTSTVILGVTDRLILDPAHRYLVTPLAEPGLWGLEMDLLATGSALRWLASLLGDGIDEAGVVALAAQVDPADAPVVLPYLSPGEQGALWNPSLTGTITGITLAHGRQHLARGLVNGIILESRRCLAVLDEIYPFRPELLVAGGSATAASFRADLAAATGRGVVTIGDHAADQSARGAAIAGARAIGRPLPTCDYRNPHGAEPPAARTEDGDAPRAWSSLWAAYEQSRRSLGDRKR